MTDGPAPDDHMPEASPGAGSATMWDERPTTWRDWLELVGTVVLALAAILTAWSAFQSAKWSGLQSIAFAEAGAARTESARAANLAGQQAQVDIGVFLRWVAAFETDLRDGNIPEPASLAAYEPDPETVAGFIYLRIRPEFRPAFDAWLATNPIRSPGAPASPFEMEEYQLEASKRADELLATAEARAQDARDDNQTSDNYVLATVVFAAVLFFVGLSTKLRSRWSSLGALGFGILLFVGAAVTVLTFPIEV